MSLFQQAVLNKYLKSQDKDAVAKAFKKFSKHFHNPKIQENIRNSKEEQYQEGFLRELFVDVFGFTLNPQPNFNLTTELKNEKGSKKVDGAILKDGNAIGVIELKGTDTKDLEKVRQQAFDYKANQTACVYVITSNFEKLRFYINNAVDFEEFDLFTLSETQFQKLYLCLAAENMLNNIPLAIKDASVVEQENITKKFYADYSLFKRELFRDLVKKNLRNDVFRGVLAAEETSKADKNIKLTLFKKSQKLIDRFLFIFFAEDRGLLPPNSTHIILEEWNKLKDLDAAVPLYNRFKLYFNYLDTGRKGTNEKAEIFAYNGGLFKPDNTLDSLLLDDELLYKHTKKLSEYDFESQVDVNILGHIFENSLNEIESVNAEIEGTDFDKQKTKRKKDGVFYTPKYITKYIVDNTVGKLCTEKRAELGIIDEEYTAKRQKDTKRILLDKLDEYRAWLLELTICDPACGSGAFLNQALDFLIKEHESVDELQAAVLGGAIVFQEIENTILEKNIYGVDLNEESVEIAKLSLWLRTAQPRRKLNSLNNNIKCGNSLIDSKAVAGDKAFKWEEEFPEVFKKGGFDVIIGNPPYVRQELFTEYKPYLKSNYKCYNSIADLYTYFIEKGIDLMKENGLFSFILPNKFMKSNYGREIRTTILEKSSVELIFDFEDYPVFEDATTYPIIFIFSKREKKERIIYSVIDANINNLDPIEILESKKFEVDTKSLTSENWTFLNPKVDLLNDKINRLSISLKVKVDDNIFRGVSTGCNQVFIVNELTKNRLGDFDGLQKIYTGKEVKRYKAEFQNLYLLFLPWEYDLDSNAAVKEYLLENKEILSKRPEVIQGRFNWWCLSRYGSKNSHLLTKPKIIYPRINNKCNFYIDQSGEFSLSDNNFFISSDNKALLAFLNSSISFFFLKNNCTTLQGGYWDFRRPTVERIPVHMNLARIENELSELAEKQLKFNEQQIFNSVNFSKYLINHFSLEQLNGKLQSYYELTFSDFIKELNKAIKTAGGTALSKLQEMEWMEVFEVKKKEALALKTEIDRTDKEIDQLVYELYGLTEEEIGIVEGN